MPLNSNNFQQRQRGKQKTSKPSTISLCEALREICLLQVEPLGTMQYLPRPCWDLLAAGKIQVFQLCRLAQGLKQICGALCSLCFFVEAPAVFGQNQFVEKILSILTRLGQLRLIPQLHHSDDAPKLEQRQTETNARHRKQENLQHHPSTISLCQALIEICLLQVEPLGTTNFLPCCCGDVIAESEIQLFQQRRLIQCLKQICGSICSLGVFDEAPAVFCQKKSVEKI